MYSSHNKAKRIRALQVFISHSYTHQFTRTYNARKKYFK